MRLFKEKTRLYIGLVSSEGEGGSCTRASASKRDIDGPAKGVTAIELAAIHELGIVSRAGECVAVFEEVASTQIIGTMVCDVSIIPDELKDVVVSVSRSAN